ncbi:MAG: WxcM-like [Hyphomicrobiales bacterium]|nr:WxcM-like [Hyphomicrobiales bacterium]
MTDASVHPVAEVRSETIGLGTRIWQFVVVLAGARIRRDCNIYSHCLSESDVMVGDRFRVNGGVQLCDGSRIVDDVFVGLNVAFGDDKCPISGDKRFDRLNSWIDKGAVICSDATVFPGVRIGNVATVGAGAVVTEDVPARAAVVGTPAGAIKSARP